MSFLYKIIKLVSVLTIILQILGNSSYAFELSPGEYESIRKVITEMMVRYPPSQYVYVGIGGSTTPFLAVLNSVVDDKQAFNLPASRLNQFKASAIRPLDEKVVRRFHEHLDRFLPEEALNGKKILLFDSADSGAGMINLNNELTTYLETRGRGGRERIKPVGLPLNKRAEDNLRLQNIDMIKLEDGVLKDKLISQLYDDYREFSSFSVTGGVWPEHLYVPPQKMTRELKRQKILDELRNTRFEGEGAEKIQLSYEAKAKKEIELLEDYDDMVKAFKTKVDKDADFQRIVRELIAGSNPVLPQKSKIPLNCGGLIRYLKSLSP